MGKLDSLATIHGYISSDGGIYSNKIKDIHGKKIRIRTKLRTKFYNSEDTLINDFLNNIKSLYPNVKSIRYYEKRMEVEIRNNTISQDILGLGKVWSKNWEFPEKLTNKQKKLWLRAFIDCDGTVQNRKYDRFVAIDSVNKVGLNKISTILRMFNLPNKVYNIKGGSYRLKIFGKDNLIRFNSIIKLKHPRKRKLLKEAINSYK